MKTIPIPRAKSNEENLKFLPESKCKNITKDSGRKANRLQTLWTSDNQYSAFPLIR